MLSGVVSRFPLHMFPFAVLLLVVRVSGSYASAGTVAAAAAIGLACGTPVHGRLVDRYGQTLPLRITASANAVAFCALLCSATLGAGVLTLGACTVFVALTLPPVTVAQRALWPTLLPDSGQRRLALALDSQLLDASMVTGPLLVSAVSLIAGPAAAVAVAGAAIQVGTWWFSFLPTSRSRQGTRQPGRNLWGPLHNRALRALLAVGAMTGALLGAVRVGLVGFAGERGVPEGAGLALAAFGLGSMCGGLLYARRARGPATGARLRMLTGCYAVGTLALVAAPSVPWLVALCVLGGSAMGPVTVVVFELVGARAPRESVAESYAWVITATFLGAAMGNALTGFLTATLGVRYGLLTTTGFGAAALLVTVLNRESLDSPDSGSPDSGSPAEQGER